MGIQQNMADMLRMIMTMKNMTLAECAEALEISRSTLQDYLKAQGNPTAVMIEHLAGKLGITPAALLTGLLDMDRRDVILLLLQTIQEVAALPKDKQFHFAQLFLEMALLWNEKDPNPINPKEGDHNSNTTQSP